MLALFLDIILVKNLNFPVVLRLISGTLVRRSCFVIDFARTSCQGRSQELFKSKDDFKIFVFSAWDGVCIFKQNDFKLESLDLDKEPKKPWSRNMRPLAAVRLETWDSGSDGHYLIIVTSHFRAVIVGAKMIVRSAVLTRLSLKMYLWQFTQNCTNLPNAPFWSDLGPYLRSPG